MRAEANTVLLIRADASTAIGTGHVMRCLALTQAWLRTGGSAWLLQAESLDSLTTRVAAAGILTATIAAIVGSEADAQATIAQARAIGAKWVVADGYRFGAAWQRAVRAAGLRVMLLDDCGHAPEYAPDVLLNQNLGADLTSYPKRDAATRFLLGARFALLREEFQMMRGSVREVPERARKILITLGGSDPDNVTGQVLNELLIRPETEIAVVVGGGNPHLDTLRAMIGADRPAVRLIVNATNMPELMAWADVAVSAAGSTAWELAFMGLPAVLIVVADNQAGIAAALAAQGISEHLGDHQLLPPGRIAAAVDAVCAAVGRRREMSERGRALIDGHGARRVGAVLGAALKLTIVSDATSWMNTYLPALKADFEQAGHTVAWIHDPAKLVEGDLAFFLSLSRIVPEATLGRHAHNLVVHESAVPSGRGWSPLTWQVLEGKNEIPVTLLEAAAEVDSGEVLAQTVIRLRGNELVDELRSAQANATFAVCREFVARYPFSLADARPQRGEPSHYPRRRPADSRLDPDRSLREQFNLLRVADPERYPAYFELAGRRYEVRVAAREANSA